MSTLNMLSGKFNRACIDEGAVRYNLEPEKYQRRLKNSETGRVPNCNVLLQAQNIDTCSCQFFWLYMPHVTQPVQADSE